MTVYTYNSGNIKKHLYKGKQHLIERMTLQFVKPSVEYIPSFISALKEGTFTHMALGDFGDRPVEEVEHDPEAYLAVLNDPAPRNVKTPNGETFTFTDHSIMWVIDESGRFMAGISLRFDDNELIRDYCGHAGMSVRPALLNKGYGVKSALGVMTYVQDEASKRNMDRLLASANPDNPASWRLLEYLGGKLIRQDDPFGFGESKLYEIKM